MVSKVQFWLYKENPSSWTTDTTLKWPHQDVGSSRSSRAVSWHGARMRHQFAEQDLCHQMGRHRFEIGVGG